MRRVSGGWLIGIAVNLIHIGWAALSIAFGAHAATAEGRNMEVLTLVIDGQQVALSQSPRLVPCPTNGLHSANAHLSDRTPEGGDRVLVPVLAFSEALDAEVKKLDGNGSLAVCMADLCIPLSEEETMSLDGEVFAYLSAFGGELGLRWQLAGSTLRVSTGKRMATGMAVGSRPPVFELPDLHTGATVSSADFVGKKALFYVWASW
jgi:hypothetical protein